jgi:hypothetical protein
MGGVQWWVVTRIKLPKARRTKTTTGSPEELEAGASESQLLGPSHPIDAALGEDVESQREGYQPVCKLLHTVEM